MYLNIIFGIVRSRTKATEFSLVYSIEIPFSGNRLLHADERTGRRTDTTQPVVTCCKLRTRLKITLYFTK